MSGSYGSSEEEWEEYEDEEEYSFVTESSEAEVVKEVTQKMATLRTKRDSEAAAQSSSDLSSLSASEDGSGHKGGGGDADDSSLTTTSEEEVKRPTTSHRHHKSVSAISDSSLSSDDESSAKAPPAAVIKVQVAADDSSEEWESEGEEEWESESVSLVSESSHSSSKETAAVPPSTPPTQQQAPAPSRALTPPPEVSPPRRSAVSPQKVIVNEHCGTIKCPIDGPIELDIEDMGRICRCGHSNNFPWCDNTHLRVNEAEGTQYEPWTVDALALGSTLNICGCGKSVRREQGIPLCDYSCKENDDDVVHVTMGPKQPAFDETLPVAVAAVPKKTIAPPQLSATPIKIVDRLPDSTTDVTTTGQSSEEEEYISSEEDSDIALPVRALQPTATPVQQQQKQQRAPSPVRPAEPEPEPEPAAAPPPASTAIVEAVVVDPKVHRSAVHEQAMQEQEAAAAARREEILAEQARERQRQMQKRADAAEAARRKGAEQAAMRKQLAERALKPPAPVAEKNPKRRADVAAPFYRVAPDPIVESDLFDSSEEPIYLAWEEGAEARSRALGMAAPQGAEVLYCTNWDPSSAAVRLLVQAKRLPVRVVMQLPPGARASDAEIDVFPLLELTSGQQIRGALHIVEYLSERYRTLAPSFAGSSSRARSQSAIVSGVCQDFLIPLLYLYPSHTVVALAGRPAVPMRSADKLKVFNDIVAHLDSIELYASRQGPYLHGKTATVSDALLFPLIVFYQNFCHRLSKVLWQERPKLRSWFSSMLDMEAFGKLAKDMETSVVEEVNRRKR